MPDLFFVALLLFCSGFLPAVVILPPRCGVVGAPAVSAVILGIFISITPLAGISVRSGALLAIIVTNAAAIVVLSVRCRQGHGGRITDGSLRETRFSRHSFVMAAAAASPLLGVRQGAYAWDFRSIWLLHANTFSLPVEAFHSMFHNSALAFAHLDYPPLAPSVMVWANRFIHGASAEVSQSALAVVCSSALAVALFVIYDGVVERVGSQRVALFVALGFMLCAFVSLREALFNGYVDALWALLLAVGVLLIVMTPNGIGGRSLIWFAGAASAKNEGMIIAFACLIIAAICLRMRSKWAILLVGAPSILWTVFVRLHGATGDYGPDSIRRITSSPATVLSRASIALQALGTQVVGTILVLAVIFIVTGRTFNQAWFQPIDVRRQAVTLALVCAITALILVGSYSVSAFDIRWHLSTSIDRTTMVLRLLLLITAAWLASQPMVLRRNQVLTAFAGATIPLAMAAIVAQREFISLVEPTRAAALQFQCIARELDEKIPPGTSVFVSATPGLWSQRLVEFSLSRHRVSETALTTDYLVDGAPNSTAKCGFELKVTAKGR